MIAIFLHPAAHEHIESGEDFLLDELAVVRWIERELPGKGAALIDVDRLRSLARDRKLLARLEPMEGFTMVLVAQRP